jgi:hypothetical protein
MDRNATWKGVVSRFEFDERCVRFTWLVGTRDDHHCRNSGERRPSERGDT